MMIALYKNPQYYLMFDKSQVLILGLLNNILLIFLNSLTHSKPLLLNLTMKDLFDFLHCLAVCTKAPSPDESRKSILLKSITAGKELAFKTSST